ncbi:MAG: cytochrome d ubiquinol oxidase subunit II [Candidatus Obscuribacterales bacterium]|nr:cytochrome d ubiquinol oxidase subunit II [Candidatus Obscuribacterales bacterium]
MLPIEVLLAIIMVISLNFYVLLGGADYGGGVWDLLSFGPRRDKQRELIAEAIGPIWEANHVWLILVIVILFTGFPLAFGQISTYLNIPLTLMLVGIVLRGSAFTFRSYDTKDDSVQRRWGRMFAIASTITPILIGILVGAISSDKFPLLTSDFVSSFVWTWLRPFPVCVGFFALILFAFLASVYLTLEAEDADVKEDFRKRALVSSILVFLMAVLVFLLAGDDAPHIRHVLTNSIWTIPLHLATGFFAIGAIITLWMRKYDLARLFTVLQVSLILWGWALAQFPFLVRPAITIYAAAAPKITLELLLGALIAGALLLFPSFYYLFVVFKTKKAD